MRILQLNLNNFFSFKQVDFDFRDKSDLIFVSGLNGAGKSALFVEAIPWALYGLTIREKVYGSTSREFSKDDVVNESAGKDCWVSVYFSVGNSDYNIVRYRNHSEYGNRVFLFETPYSSKDISGESTKETNQKIVDLIKLNYSAYSNAVVFGQGTIKRFTQCTDSERRKILEDFLQLQIYTDAREIAKKDWKRLNETLSDLEKEEDICDARITEVSYQLTQAEQTVEEHRITLDSYDASVKEILKSKKTRLTDIKKESKTITQDITELKQDKTDVEQVLEELRNLGKDRPLVDDIISEIAEKKTQFNSNAQDIHKGETNLKKFKIGDECPSCFRQLRNTDLTQYKNLITTEIKQLRISNTAIDEKLENLKSLRDELQELRDEEVDMTQGLQALDRKREKEEASRNALIEEAKRIEAEISNATDMSESLTANIRKAEGEVAQLEKRKFFLTKVQEIKGVRIHEVQAEADEAKFWIDGFSSKGVKDLIFAQSLGYLNDKLTRYASAISAGTISVQINRDLSVAIDITDGAKVYQTASGGQARRIDLMIGLALQSLVEAGWQDVNVKFIDEFDASLDKAGVDGFLALLREEAQQKNAIFIISHNDYLAKQLDQVIYVELENGESKIITG